MQEVFIFIFQFRVAFFETLGFASFKKPAGSEKVQKVTKKMIF